MSTISESQGNFAPGRIMTTINPYTEITLHQALEMEMQGNHQKALEIYDQVIQMDPRDARAFQAKGDIYDMMGRYDDALICYNSALECDPFNAEAWYNKGVTLSKMGCQDDSAECVRKSVNLSV